jgi:hypothetical protein
MLCINSFLFFYLLSVSSIFRFFHPSNACLTTPCYCPHKLAAQPAHSFNTTPHTLPMSPLQVSIPLDPPNTCPSFTSSTSYHFYPQCAMHYQDSYIPVLVLSLHLTAHSLNCAASILNPHITIITAQCMVTPQEHSHVFHIIDITGPPLYLNLPSPYVPCLTSFYSSHN